MATSQAPQHLSTTPPAPSRSPSFTTTSGAASDAEVSMEAEEESADDSDFLDGDLDDPANSSLSLSITVPALATPKPHSSSTPWPFTSISQASPTLLPTTAPYSPDLIAPAAIPASSLPHEILLHILRLLPAPALSPALRVCKAWCQCGVELLWHKPAFTTLPPLTRMLSVISSPDQTFPYPTFVRRLNFSALHASMDDATLLQLIPCVRLERLTLAGCKTLEADSLMALLSRCERLIALDLSDVINVTDEVAEVVARNCPKLQGLNLSGCKEITDRGIEAIARACPGLRRIKLRNVENLTDVPIILLSLNCPLLLEVDLIFCPRITSLALLQLFRTSHHLRELSLQACVEVTDEAFPTQEMVAALGSTRQYNLADDRETASSEPEGEPLVASDGSLIKRPIPIYAPPKLKPFDHLRYLDLTSLTQLTDDALAGIVKYMPKIRNLIVAKCSRLSDDAVYSICQLGKHLHYLHLGHVSAITDVAVTTLARSCTRLRYIDLACCHLLTDMAVFELASNLPRLKRIGLVRVTNITDHAVHALFVRTSLERIHLSYCENLTVLAIHGLLQHLPRLTHLSLTGVPAFRRADLQTWCRTPPRNFNTHQRTTFCVYSGKGVHELRRFLRAMHADAGQGDEATRNGNGHANGGPGNGLGAPPTAVARAIPNPRRIPAAAQQQHPQHPNLHIPPHNPHSRNLPSQQQPANRHLPQPAPLPNALYLNQVQMPPGPRPGASLAAAVAGRRPVPVNGAPQHIPIPVQYVPPPAAPFTRNAGPSTRSSAPPTLASSNGYAALAPSPSEASAHARPWNWDEVSAGPSSAGGPSTSLRSAQTQTDANGTATRPRGATVTRGNYRGDEDMREASDGEDDGEGGIDDSFGEEDVEMN